MKDLSQMVKGIDRNNITEHQEKPVIDEFAKGIINRVFDNLAIIFPGWQYNWKTQEQINGAKREWTKAFIENNICTMEQISHGFSKARKSETNFLPSCGVFISWCTPSPEDLGYPSEARALEQCVTHRNKIKMHLDSDASHFIQTLCKCVDWWVMNTANGQNAVNVAKKLFREEYLNLIATYQEPVETPSQRLETSSKVRGRMSEQQLEDGRKRGLSVLAEIKAKLKHKVN
jgi:hypothetical protein